MSHTPTPWKYRLSQRGSRLVELKRDHWELGGADNKGVGLIFGDDEANAAFIVQAVNSHAPLVAALEAIVERNEKSWGGLPDWHECFNAAKAALAAAKGEP